MMDSELPFTTAADPILDLVAVSLFSLKISTGTCKARNLSIEIWMIPLHTLRTVVYISLMLVFYKAL